MRTILCSLHYITNFLSQVAPPAYTPAAGLGCHASSGGSSQPRGRTQVSCIAGAFFPS